MKKTITLALQGGGAHGAFTWGVLDRLLDEPRLAFEAVSGTSAGAMNAAMLVDGLKRGGRAEARARLEAFWRRIAGAGSAAFTPGRRLVPAMGPAYDWSPAAIWSEAVSLVWSPYDNPFYENLLADVVAESLPDFTALNDSRTPYLFVCATNVRTNRQKIFGAGELTVDALAASACLPTLFRAIEIHGQCYWDGGYMGNPALGPLRSPSLVPDLLLVWVNPLRQPVLPRDARAILDRQNEITFNATLVQEIAAIDAINDLKAKDRGNVLPFKQILLHEIKNDPHMATLGYASKSDTDWAFLTELREIGRHAADRWLDAHFDDIGRAATADVREILRCVESH
jgi:NTE family protein